MDKLAIEKRLAEMDQRIETLEKPVRQAFDAIENLMNKPLKTENLELIEFKLELSKVLTGFYKTMADAHDEIIDNREAIEKMLE